MSDHHGLDLKAIEAASGGHSIFAPSGSAMWLTCSGSLIPNLTAPDTAGIDAAEGTVGHEVAEEWLTRIKVQNEDPDPELTTAGSPYDLIDWCAPREWIGQVRTIQERTEAFDIEITEEMLAYVRQYVEWCFKVLGEHYIEERVYFSQLTPIDNQGGTADHFACSPGLLVITDLKYGKGVQVFAEGNTQARLYALGVFFKYDYLYDFQKITIRIAQPRLEHFDVWEITREELLEFAEYVRERAAAAWVFNAPRTPSPKGCLWCKVKSTCPALLAWTHEAVDDVFDDLTQDEDGVIEGVTYSVATMGAATDAMEAGREIKPVRPDVMSTEAMAKLLPYRKTIERWFAEIEAELEHRAMSGEQIPGFKLVKGREGNRTWMDETDAPTELEFIGVETDDLFTRKLISPAQAEEKLKKTYRLSKDAGARLLSHLVTRAPGKQTLVPEDDKRPALEDVGDVFDIVSDDDDL